MMQPHLMTIRFFGVALVASLGFACASDAAELPLPIQASVKSIGPVSPPPVADSMRMPTPQAAPLTPTLPTGKLPQYQLGHEQMLSTTSRRPDDPAYRFFLALPDQLLLVQVNLTIDGQPFAMAREARVKSLVKAAATVSAEESAADAPEEISLEKVAEAIEPADPDGEASESETVTLPTRPAFAQVTGAADFFRRYYAAIGSQPNEDEIRWLLTQRVDGPVLLLLSENFQRFRATERPAFNVLDRDVDGVITKDEISKAVDSFERCDENRNGIIEYKELETMSNRAPSNLSSGGTGKLILPLPTESTAAVIYNKAASHYGESLHPLNRFDKDSSGGFDSDEIKTLSTTDPDLELSVAFDSADVQKSSLLISRVSKSIAGRVSSHTTSHDAISLSILPAANPDSAPTTVAFSAIQRSSSDQISIGAVSDGYPMLPALDPNEDGRFTLRERRELVQRVNTLDANKDGSITADEARSTIRVCFALGPYVHQELASIRELGGASRSKSVVGPEWFQRMDRNDDNDISPSEFSGNEQQFAVLDADSDKLISAAEAIAFENKDTKAEPSEPKTDAKESAQQESDGSTPKE